MKSPIFIVGANRSGTTLLRLILNAHSNIAIPEEVLYFRSQIGPYQIDDWAAASITIEEYKEIVAEFIRRVEIPDLDKLEVAKLLEGMPKNLRSPYKGLMEYWTRTQEKIRWGEKTPGNLFYSDIINEMFPDAKFIHMVRDPRAGVFSMEQVWFFPEDVIFNALSRHKHMTVGRATLENSVPKKRILTLRYEDLVADPMANVRQICEFIGEKFEDQMMTYYKGAGKHMRSDAAAGFNASATKPISASGQDKWKAGLSRSDIAAIELISEQEMEEFGYQPVSKRIGPLVRLAVHVKSKYWAQQEKKNAHNRHFTVRYKMLSGIKRRFGYKAPRRRPDDLPEH